MTPQKPVRQAQLIRQWRLLRLLQQYPEGRSHRELGTALGIGTAAVFRDLETLRAAGFPVVKGRHHAKAVWKLEGEKTPAVKFTPEELRALVMANQLLSCHAGSPFYWAMRDAFGKIQAAYGREAEKIVEVADRSLYANVKRSRPYTNRQIWFKVIYQAIFDRRTVWVKYYTMERQAESEREIDPYGLVFHEGAFYVVGYCHNREAIRTFLIDRIVHARETKKVFAPPPGFSAKEHLKHAWGILKQKMLARVRVRFDSSIAKIIHEGRWHETQRLDDQKDGSVVMSVDVAGWEEIRRWILGFGALAEVLEPAELRESIVSEIGKLEAKYGRKK